MTPLNDMFAVMIVVGLICGAIWAIVAFVTGADRAARRVTKKVTGTERGFLAPPAPPPPMPVDPLAMYKRSGMDVRVNPSTGKYEVALTVPTDFYQALRDDVLYVSGSTAVARRQRAFSQQWAEATEPAPGKRHVVLNETAFSYLALYEFPTLLRVWSQSDDLAFRTYASNGRLLHDTASAVRSNIPYEVRRQNG